LSDVSDKSCLCIDFGLYSDFALRLAREFDKVGIHIYSAKKARPIVNERAIGTGFDEIKPEYELWDAIDDYDCIAIPDVGLGHLASWLRRKGYNVWGSGKGEQIEIYRWFSKELIASLGLPVQPVELIEGMTNLRSYLQKHDNKFVKISVVRGMLDSRKHSKYWMSEPWLNDLQHRLGPLDDEMYFIVEDKIKTRIELGADWKFLGGRFASRGLNGLEIKDSGYAGVVQDFRGLPDQLRVIYEKFAPTLAKIGYNNDLSIEVRVPEKGKDADKPFLIDITARRPAPGGEAQDELISNIGEQVYEGAHNRFVESEFTKPFVAQAMIFADRESTEWVPVDIPAEHKQYVKLYNHCRRKGHDYVVPQPDALTDPASENEIGTVVGVGDTMDEATEMCAEIAEQVDGDQIYIKTDSLKEATKELEIAEERGISFAPARLTKRSYATIP
jgi:hypothetical protein